MQASLPALRGTAAISKKVFKTMIPNRDALVPNREGFWWGLDIKSVGNIENPGWRLYRVRMPAWYPARDELRWYYLDGSGGAIPFRSEDWWVEAEPPSALFTAVVKGNHIQPGEQDATLPRKLQTKDKVKTTRGRQDG